MLNVCSMPSWVRGASGSTFVSIKFVQAVSRFLVRDANTRIDTDVTLGYGTVVVEIIMTSFDKFLMSTIQIQEV